MVKWVYNQVLKKVEMKIKQLRAHGYKVYKRQDISFGVKKLSVLAVTNLQDFILRVDHPSQNKELAKLIHMIEARKINTTSDIVSQCKYRPNDDEVFSYFLGVQMLSTRLDYYL